MKVQKFNPNTIIYKNAQYLDPSKSIIEQIEDYIDSLDLKDQEPIFHNVNIHGGWFVIIGVCTTKNSWSTFLTFGYFGNDCYYLYRNSNGDWYYKSLI